MFPEQINITLGTAGHIDHGKTALIRNLTGCDTDRLKEEKERGMSIELGFAPCRLGNLEVGVVDVPGHENFIRTMVAGATSIDGVIFVVAADDGVMPQTREHLDILTLLNIRHGVVALTKSDRVPPDELEAAREAVRAFLQGTFLAEAPIIPVSNITGEGLGELYRQIEAMVATIRPRPLDGLFRLPVERAFSTKGYGTVVCGVPVSGSARIGDELVLLPHDLRGRIKAIQVFRRPGQEVRAGQCTAINIPHWDHRLIRRGDVLTVPDCFVPRTWFACRLRLLPGQGIFLKSGSRAKFHTGTADLTATVYPMTAPRLQAGEEALVQIRTDSALVAGPGDRFILRSLSPVRTIGGGCILEPLPQRRRRRPEVLADLEALADALADEARHIEHHLRRAMAPATPDELALACMRTPEQARQVLCNLVRDDRAIRVGQTGYLHTEAAERLEARLLTLLDEYHCRCPESPGMTLEQVYQALDTSKETAAACAERLKARQAVIKHGQRLALPSHRPRLADGGNLLAERAEQAFRNRPFAPPGAHELAAELGITPPQATALIQTLIERERLVRVAPDLVFHREAVENARRILIETIRREGPLESVRFKYLLATTRKFAIPLLDYFDRIGLTLRRNNTRYLRPN